MITPPDYNLSHTDLQHAIPNHAPTDSSGDQTLLDMSIRLQAHPTVRHRTIHRHLLPPSRHTKQVAQSVIPSPTRYGIPISKSHVHLLKHGLNESSGSTQNAGCHMVGRCANIISQSDDLQQHVNLNQGAEYWRRRTNWKLAPASSGAYMKRSDRTAKKLRSVLAAPR
ncbi:hypothetical protein BC835DRAFT_1358939 [Cytidiella melzeri]|nr:hypothetical protein BC835DRAFT_1358939 [Cytidiella melzeri]